MQVNISTRHGHLSDKTQEKIRSKVERLSRYFERLAAIEVTVNLDNQDAPTVEILVSAEHKHDFVATEKSTALMASVDGAVRKVEQQLRKYKEKIQERHRDPEIRRRGVLEEPESENA
ncbi:MAG: ribosome hibernation-promoting factor, HPF/YfiA family [Pirellulales bacterium]